MSQHRILKLAIVFTFLLVISTGQPLRSQQKMDSLNIDRARGILHDAYDNVKKHYYDPKYHDVDLDARFRAFDEKIRTAQSLSESFGLIAGFLDGLNDSHTFFMPPSRPYHVDYGYRMQIYGDNCFVTRVRPSTDAESKVHPGDQVLAYNNFAVNRADFWKMDYYFNSLAPQKATILQIRQDDGSPRQVTIDAKIHELKRTLDFTGQNGGGDIWEYIRERQNWGHNVRQRWGTVGDVMVWKMPEFILSDGEIDRIFNDARKHKALILDLRDDPGGANVTLDRMLGNVFDHDVKIADRTGRKEMKPEVAKTRGKDAFDGKLIVLVDSRSASCAELFPRVIQLEHRGIVIGDRTAGAVMEARHYPGAQGADTKIFYSFSVTEADMIMKDGKSLEHVGVIPDESVIPTGKDLASGSDPALARAAQLAGLNLDPVAAGKMFPFEWLPIT
ncbi:MAG: S41 family peptidase [Candidatus Acidiferrales bacterium]